MTHEAGDEEELFGVNPESTPLIVTAVLLALLVGAAVWWRPIRVVLLIGVGF